MGQEEKGPAQRVRELIDMHRLVAKMKALESESRQKDDRIREVTEQCRELGEQLEALRGDTADHERVVDELRRSEQKYRSTVEDAVGGFFQSTPDRRLLSVNAELARMMGFDSPAEMIELVTDLAQQYHVNPQDYWYLSRLLEEEGVVKAFETEVRRKNGESIWVSLSVRAVRHEGGQTLYYEAMVQDLTGRKRAEEGVRRDAERSRAYLDGVIKTIGLILELKDPYKAGHAPRVARLASALAEEMTLPQDISEGLALAAALHDIGTLRVPSEALCKPGPLSTADLSLVKTHPRAGQEILQAIDFPWPVAEIVLQHHERLDGSGYPQGLSGETIRLEAKIIAVADVVEAMCSTRSYRPARGKDSALEEISQQKGILYDSAVVDACLSLFREKGFGWE